MVTKGARHEWHSVKGMDVGLQNPADAGSGGGTVRTLLVDAGIKKTQGLLPGLFGHIPGEHSPEARPPWGLMTQPLWG